MQSLNELYTLLDKVYDPKNNKWLDTLTPEEYAKFDQIYELIENRVDYN